MRRSRIVRGVATAMDNLILSEKGSSLLEKPAPSLFAAEYKSPPISSNIATTAKSVDVDRRSLFIRGLHEKAMVAGAPLTFYDLLMDWSDLMDCEDEMLRRSILQNMCTKEQQLLNAKLLDSCFTLGYIKLGSNGVKKMASDHGVDDGIGSLIGGDNTGFGAGNGFFINYAKMKNEKTENLSDKVAQRYPGEYFNCYSIAHFATELGDFSWLQDMLSAAHDSIPYYSAIELQRGIVPDSFPNFRNIVMNGYDFNGYSLVHLASSSGNVEILDFLLHHFTPDFLLRQKKRRSVRSTLWGSETHQNDLNAVGCAITHNQVGVLDYLYSNFPSVLTMINVEELNCALTSAALAEDSVLSLDFLRSVNLISPILTGEDCMSSVMRNGCVGALGAAAEAGQLKILEWMMEIFGERVLSCPGHGSVTALHHCARGANAETLKALLKNDKVRGFVDVEDGRGRTPAMWCVLGRNKAGKTVDTLKVLYEAGSCFKYYKDHSGSTVLDMAQRHYSPFSKVMRYLNSIK